MHKPVLLSQFLTQLAPREGGAYLDGTFGAGGYSRALLSSCTCRVLACDRDSAALPYAQSLREQFGERFQFFTACFSEIPALLARAGYTTLDGMVLDLGVSAMQIDVPERGFSFQKKGPLDMRMGANALSAAEVVNTFPEEQISEILWTYGEEPKSRAIARKIVEARRKRPLQTTWDLQRLVASVVRGSPLRDPATRTFQALRIFVNDELGELQKALLHAEKYLKAGGRLVVVAFHSLEDRLVKRFLNGPEAPVDPISGKPLPGKGPFAPLYKKPMTPSEEEKRMHPRARSAKMRVGVKQP